MARPETPPPRPVLHPLRPVDPERVSFTPMPHLRRRITIDHRPLPGVTATMLLRWFSGIGGTLEYGGRTVPRYLAWHPLDHVHWALAREAPGGGAAEGARFRIVEELQARPEYRVDVVDRVEKLDRTGIRLVQRVLGVPVTQLEHTWSDGADGVHYVSVLDLGARAALLRPVNQVLRRRFPDAMVRAWVRHNVEEVGQLEFLLPQLFPEEAGVSAPSAARG